MASLATRFSPFRNGVLISVLRQSQTAGGVFYPESAASASVEKGKVVAVGNGRTTEVGAIPMETKVGDTVLLPTLGGHKIRIEGEELRLLPEDMLLGKYKD